MSLKTIIKLFRFPNLLMIGLTQVLFQYFIIIPILDVYHLKPSLSHGLFLGIVISTMLVAAAGYLINDYFDVSIDSLKKTNIIETLISKEKAFEMYLWLNGLALVLAGVISFAIEKTTLVSLFAFAILMLWFYASSASKNKITGNLLVALLTAFTLIVVFLYEPKLRDVTNLQYGNLAYNSTFYALIIYAIFAFLSNWIREIVKDCEDHAYDDEAGRTSLPIVLGLKQTKVIIILLLVVFAVFLLYVAKLLSLSLSEDLLKISYLAVLFVLLLLTAGFVYKAKSVNQFRIPSLILKIIMLLGVLTMPIFYCINALSVP